ncbi:hypothetical protein MELB17_24022 [Marinobacter sp. ELB17]|nr:hypothetical protein MELB17_24022 [Marinobacter sp. ELB17]
MEIEMTFEEFKASGNLVHFNDLTY